MNGKHQKLLTENITGGFVQASKSIQERMLAQLTKADKNYAAMVNAAMENMAK